MRSTGSTGQKSWNMWDFLPSQRLIIHVYPPLGWVLKSLWPKLEKLPASQIQILLFSPKRAVWRCLGQARQTTWAWLMWDEWAKPSLRGSELHPCIEPSEHSENRASKYYANLRVRLRSHRGWRLRVPCDFRCALFRNGEGLVGFGAEPGHVRVPEALVQSPVTSNRVPEKVPEKVWEALVQSRVRFNRVPEKHMPGSENRRWNSTLTRTRNALGFDLGWKFQCSGHCLFYLGQWKICRII